MPKLPLSFQGKVNRRIRSNICTYVQILILICNISIHAIICGGGQGQKDPYQRQEVYQSGCKLFAKLHVEQRFWSNPSCAEWNTGLSLNPRFPLPGHVRSCCGFLEGEGECRYVRWGPVRCARDLDYLETHLFSINFITTIEGRYWLTVYQYGNHTNDLKLERQKIRIRSN